MTLGRSIELHDGHFMPSIGLGTWQLSGSTAREAIHTALEAGYRLIDTAAMYQNEREVGEAIREAEIPREEIFVTTKLNNPDHGYEAALKAFDRSLATLTLEYVDLYLIHWPVEGLRQETWRALVKIREEGRARSIGVSNYTVRHLEDLRTKSEVVPVVNQVEFHPWVLQRDLLDYCREQGIVLEAYSPLVKGNRLRNRVLVEVAETHEVSPAQVLVRWNLQHGTVPIPKSSKPDHIRANIDVWGFSLSDEEMNALDGLHDNSRTDWDPTDVE